MKLYGWQKSPGIYLTLILILSSYALAQDTSRFDLSTNEGVNEARSALVGKKLLGNSLNCIRRPKELPGIIMVGLFAHDRGCMLDGAFIKKRFINDKNNLSKPALENLGWQKADSKRREEIALKWTQFGLLSFEHPLDEAPETFANHEFQKPKTTSEDGVVKVTLWMQHPIGMRCEHRFSKLVYTFERDGNLTGTKSLESFSVPCRRN
jgi:hypothetical protein